LAALGLGLGAVGSVACDRGGIDSERARRTPTPTPAPPPTAAPASPVATVPPGTPAVALRPVCLVTKQQGLSPSYAPPDLTPLPTRLLAGNGVQLRREAAEALVPLLYEAGRAGRRLFALSGYRSYDEQSRVLRDEIARYGRAVAEQQVAPPGHSEHQLGLAVDITSEVDPYDLREAFGTEPEGRWLAANAPRFGFLVSYPQGKEAVTGYRYEPWHIRYTGVPLAQSVAASGLTLTEFLPRQNLAGPCP
jgi:D-alanyl-D-alanine carboxypeptidase